MNLLITVCAGILATHPGCVVDKHKLLAEVTPQQCVQKAQEFIAKQQPRFTEAAYKVRKWECRRG